MEKGKRKMKSLSKAELEYNLAKLTAENDSLKLITNNVFISVLRDDNTKSYYNHSNGISIHVTDLKAVVMSRSSIRLFPNNGIAYQWLQSYVDIMTEQIPESPSNAVVKEKVEQFLYLLFDTDSNLSNIASMALDWAYWLSKNNQLLNAKGNKVTFDKLTIGVICGLMRELVIAKKDAVIDSDTATQILKDIDEKINALVSTLEVHLDDNGCALNKSIVFDQTPISESDALAEMELDEQFKTQL